MMIKSNCLNFKNICRTCFSDKCLKPIADITLQDRTNIADILMDFICREDLCNDKLPQNMCSLCVEQLYLYYKFKKACMQNESLLKKYLEQTPDDAKKDYTTNTKQDEITKNSTDTPSDNEDDNNDFTNSDDDKSLVNKLDMPLITKEKGPKKLLSNESILKKHLEPIDIKNCTIKVKQDENSDDFTYPPSDNDSNDSINSDDDKPLINRLRNVIKKTKGKQLNSLNKIEKVEIKESHSEKYLDLRDENYSCKQCDKSFTFKYKLVMHARVHTKEKPFKCDVCHLGFSLNGNLKRHKMIHTGERPHVCKICGKGFIQVTSLQMHSEKHHNGNIRQNFTCKICFRVFVRAAPYNSHLKKHSSSAFTENSEKLKEEVKHEDFKYKCEICGKIFGKLVFLRRHTSRHGEKKFLCSDCGKGFVRKADLQSHIKVHTGEKPHTCPICNKSFAHTGSLVTHSLVHSGFKPYNCSLCPKSFTQLSHLKVHKRTHSGERPYSCSFCDKTFALKSNLTVHIRTHTGETPYLCMVCGKGFYDSSSMKKHKLSHFSKLKRPVKKEADDEPENFVNND